MKNKDRNSSKCKECGRVMPHIGARGCKCHSTSCSRYKKEVKGTCTIFRKLSDRDMHELEKSMQVDVKNESELKVE